MNGRYSRQQDIVPLKKLQNMNITVIGVGSIGRNVALQLTSIGVKNLQLVDFDIVEESNISSQGYHETDLGVSKVEATAKLCKSINSKINIEIVNSKFTKSLKVGYVVFSCVDSIKTREFLWNSINQKISFFIDGRMTAEALRILCVDTKNSDICKYYSTTLFKPEEAHTGRCTAKSTIYCANIAAGFLVSNFTKWLRGIHLEKDILINLLTNEINTYEEPSND